MPANLPSAGDTARQSEPQNYLTAEPGFCSTGCAPRPRPSAVSAIRNWTPPCVFCGKLFGADYASTLVGRRYVAAKGEQKAMKA
jgi:hypothetical protein